MNESGSVECSRCGADARGKFCSACGNPLAVDAGCGGCGARFKAGALYCSDCGSAVGAPPRKTASARLPWVLSGLALAAFSVMIALLVQRGSVPRTGDMTLTGGISGPGSAAPSGSAESSSMPSMEELAAMTPRQAADRLYDRAMSEHERAMNEGGDLQQAGFFIDMGLQAYAAIPTADVDHDVNFHIGMLQFLMGDSVAARGSVEAILDVDGNHILGLILAGRVAGYAGDSEAAATFREQVRTVVDEAGGIPDRAEYQAHRPMIERALEGGG